MAQQYAPQSPSPLHSVRNASDDSIDASLSTASLQASKKEEAGVDASMQVAEQENGHDEEAASTAAREGQFARNRDRLLDGLGKTKEILNDLKEFNYGRWIVHYPEVNPPSYTLPSSPSSSSVAAGTQDDAQVLKRSASGTALASDAEPAAARRPTLEHSSTTVGTPFSAPVNGNAATAQPTRAKPIRSSTYSPAVGEGHSTAEEEQAEEEEMNDLSILRLDLKVGHQTTTILPSSSSSPNLSRQASTASAAQPLVHSLEKSSIAQLLDGRMTQAVRHLDALHMRISDKQSKVLVTGDLNAGKSTLVNALLRREVMPTDQQPCTTVFAEVLDADEENAGKEEIHVVRDGRVYRQEDEDSYMRLELDEGERLAALMEGLPAQSSSTSTELAKTNSNDGSMPLVKVFCRDRRSTQESLLRNGVVDIALIDAPGLNRDSLKTTALFARQEEIDVIVFVVNAENHFTLSAKEFLWNASNEKAYIFIVVNKFDQIRNKDKCKRLVLEQIKQLSPRTYEDAEELVHFVDSSAIFPEQDEEDEEMQSSDSTPLDTPLSDGGDSPTKKLAGEMIVAPSTPGSYRSSTDLSFAKKDIESSLAFAKLEASLRDFVLLKRSKSKLMPAQTYVLRLLSDIAFLAKTNATVARSELEQAKAQLIDARPALADCKKRSEKLALVLEDEEDETIVNSTKSAQDQLDKALQLVSQGKSPHKAVALPAYPGLFDVWQYAEKVRSAMLEGLEAAVKEVEEETKLSTASAVALVKSIGEAHLPADVEPSQRVFLPDAMFSTRRGKLSAKLYGPSAGLGISNQFAWLGLGVDVVGVRATDILDVPHYLQAIFPAFLNRHGAAVGKVNADGTPRKALTSEEEAGLAGSLTLGLGALTLVSGKALGAKAAVEAFVRVFDLIGNKTARKWAGPVLAVGVAGAVVYVIMDLPNSIPRNIGRSIQAAGVQPPINVNKLIRGDEAAASDAAPTTFTAVHTQRVSREVRKVMRLASWDLQETFRQAISERSKQVTDAEAQEKLASEAVAYFEKTGKQARRVRQEVEQVRIRDEVLPSTSA